MQWSIGGAVMRHCHIVLLHAAAAAVLLCLLLPGKTSHPVNIHESASVRFGRDRGLKSNPAVPDVPKGPQVWLYSLIGTDFPGAAALLQHWLRHYTGLGFRREQMLLVVHTRSNSTTENMAHVVEVLRGADMPFERWTGTPYSSDAHLKIKLRLMNERIKSLQDWIVIADSDEFYDFNALGSGIQGYTSRLEAANASFGAGVLVDRVAADGSLPHVQPAPSLSEQFGLHCAVVRQLTRGFPYKIVAFKAYLRTNTGNHKAVSARTAAKYFGPVPAGEKSLRGGFYGASDLYDLTPYSAQPDSYVRTLQQPQGTSRGWRAAVYPKAIAAMHFKWHSGVLQSAQERLKYYRGDVGGTLPRYQHFVESERILAMLQNGSLPIKSAECSEEMPWRVKRLPKKRKMYI